jgi:hypothetical protein
MILMKKEIRELFDVCRNAADVERACIAAYLRIKKLSLTKRTFLKQYLAGTDTGLVSLCERVLRGYGKELCIETLIDLFELLVACETRKKNGVAYTPLAVKKMMLARVLGEGKAPTVFDPSCGCAAFLLTAAEMIHRKSKSPYSWIIANCIFGADIDGNALEKTRALFAVVLIENGEDSDVVPELYELNMLKRDSIKIVLKKHPNGFDCVVGNPPYVRFRNMDDSTQRDVSSWLVSSCGNSDLYMPFFEIGMTLVSESGFLSFITSNTYLQSVNGRCLRKWMAGKKLSVEITDFRDAQLFANVTCYTCVTVLSRHGTSGVNYRRAKEPNDSRSGFSHYSFADLGEGEPWRMRNSEIDAVIRKLEGVGKPLSEYVIRNGIATLANGIYFFKPIAEDKKYYYREFNGKKWKIEKSICRKIVKPNVVHNEDELKDAIECAIFPYEEKDGRYVVVSEDKLRSKYPCAYEFLTTCRPTLDGRDKGKGEYPAWYAYGRTQGMNFMGAKLLIPYIAGAPTAVLSTDRDLMFYCGYALLNDDVDELRYVKSFMESEAFWYFIYHTSKPYSKGFMAFAKNYLVRFSIPQLDAHGRAALLSAKTVDERNALVWESFGFKREDVSAITESLK